MDTSREGGGRGVYRTDKKKLEGTRPTSYRIADKASISIKQPGRQYVVLKLHDLHKKYRREMPKCL